MNRQIIWRAYGVDVKGEVRRFFTHQVPIPPDGAVVVGVSGGVDSLVLLHVMHALCSVMRWRIYAATLDHGIRGADGAADAAFVGSTAEQWGVPVMVGQVDVPAWAAKTGQGLEAAARQVRYAFLARTARAVNAAWITVGHNQDDQAETVLLHLVRGSGLGGLGGMRSVVPVSELMGDDPLSLAKDVTWETGRPFEKLLFGPHPDAPPRIFPRPEGEGTDEVGRVRAFQMVSDSPSAEPLLVVRPLLTVPRVAIEAYAAQYGLQPRQDVTNQDQSYTRNRIRHAVIPLLETLNPAVKEVLARLAIVAQSDAALVAAAGQRALDQVLRAASSETVILDRAAWNTLSLAEQRYVIRAAFRMVRPADAELAFEHVEHALAIVARAQAGTAVTLPGGLMLRVERTTLTLALVGRVVPIMDAPGLPAGFVGQPFDAGTPVEQVFGEWVFSMGRLEAADDLLAIHADPLAAALNVSVDARLMLRTRQAGDRFCPRGMGGHSQKLADTLNSLHVPAAWRDHVPLLVIDASGNSPEIGWLVVPTPTGVRGRVAESFAIHEQTKKGMIVVLRWHPKP